MPTHRRLQLCRGIAAHLRDRGASIAPRVADLMGRELGWDDARRGDEIERYVAAQGTALGRAGRGLTRARDAASSRVALSSRS